MKIGFIGTGNMGGALISGLLNTKQHPIYVYDVQTQKAQSLADVGAYVADSVADLCDVCDVLFLTVKPNVYPAVLEELSLLSYSKTLITVAPGISVSYTQGFLPDAVVIRTMPNTPALVGAGVILIADSDNPSAKKMISEMETLLSAVGKAYIVPEALMEEGTALSGSSPAIVYRLIETMADHALSHGIPKALAVQIAAQTVLGSAKMVLETNQHPSVLTDSVCSPGGTTIAAINALCKSGFDKAVLDGLDACVSKAMSMRK